ncbi:MAG TPA: hypothetical protein VM364_06415 [Vicinamibacterales bacterium]|nr:hypothetical protein [Vicinamibacterales bacterium]
MHVLPYAAMQQADPFHGLFLHEVGVAGAKLSRSTCRPETLPDPQTGRQLRIATVEVAGAICPACSKRGEAGFVSFVADLRLAFACPHCRDLIWIAGA